jgi:expansin (peptidoglycan-binding protein)
MAALDGGIVSTLYDGTGAPLFVVSQWYTPATGALRDAATTTSRGTQTGALVVDNLTGRSQQITVTNAAGVRTFNISPTGAALTVAQLAAQTPPVTTIADLSGLSPSIT